LVATAHLETAAEGGAPEGIAAITKTHLTTD